MGNYKIVNRQSLWEGSFLRGLRISYEDPAGGLRTWEAVERVNCDGIVAVVPVTAEGEFLFIRQFRPAVNCHVIEFPAGLVEPGEDPAGAAARELREETGYVPGQITFLAEGPLSSGSSSEVLTVFLGRDLRFAGIAGRDETEDIEVLRIPSANAIGELLRLMAGGTAMDLKIFGLLELSRLKGLIS